MEEERRLARSSRRNSATHFLLHQETPRVGIQDACSRHHRKGVGYVAPSRAETKRRLVQSSEWGTRSAERVPVQELALLIRIRRKLEVRSGPQLRLVAANNRPTWLEHYLHLRWAATEREVAANPRKALLDELLGLNWKHEAERNNTVAVYSANYT